MRRYRVDQYEMMPGMGETMSSLLSEFKVWCCARSRHVHDGSYRHMIVVMSSRDERAASQVANIGRV